MNIPSIPSLHIMVVGPVTGLLSVLAFNVFVTPAISPHDRQIINELAELNESLDGVCFRSLSMANQGMRENDCWTHIGTDEYITPELIIEARKCDETYARYEANPFWDLEDLLCRRDALRSKLQMSDMNRAKIGFRWWDHDASLISGYWFCPNFFNQETMTFTCADRDSVN